MAVGCYISIVLGFNFSAMVVTFATALASVTFALSGTLTRLFESMVWVFATKAIEVGDSIQVLRGVSVHLSILCADRFGLFRWISRTSSSLRSG